MRERDSILDVNVSMNEKNELLFSRRLSLNYLYHIFVASPSPSVFSWATSRPESGYLDAA